MLDEIIEETYPSTKGAAPDEAMRDAYTRELRHAVFQVRQRKVRLSKAIQSGKLEE